MNKKNNVLLINPWIYDFAAYDFWIKPIGLLSIGAILEKYGYNLSLIDCLDRFHPLQLQKVGRHKAFKRKYGTGKFYREIVEKPKILAHVPRQFARYGIHLDVFHRTLSSLPEPNVILVTSSMTYWYPGVFKIIEIVHQKFPRVPVILGGIYATLNYDHARQFSGANHIITGPGEEKALLLVDELTGNQSDLHDFPQAWADMPEPTYHLYPHLNSLPLLTSRGCPYRCTFCASHLLWSRFEQKNPANIVHQIEYYHQKRRVNQFAFYDDALLIRQKSHLSIILESVINKNLQVTFHTPNGIHPREIDFDLAELMFRANFKTIRLSYETSDKKRQADMQHKVSDDALSNALDVLEKAGYKRNDIAVYVIMGLPDQTLEEVVESMMFVNSLGAKISLASFSPIPGTKDLERAIKNCEIHPDVDPLLTNNSIYPLLNKVKTYENFQQLRHLSKFFNFGLDQGINIFHSPVFSKIIKKLI